jgi:hypothetical protein
MQNTESRFDLPQGTLELSAKGRAHLKAESENWKRLTDLVGLILKGTVEGIS